MTPRRLIALAFIVSSLAIASYIQHGSAAQSAFTNSVQVEGFSVSYPDGWSSTQSNRVTIVAAVTTEKLATLTSGQLLVTPQVRVTREQRTSHDDAMQRLSDIAAETSDPVTHLTIGGWPAIQRRHIAPWPTAGDAAPTPGKALTITTAIAAGRQLIRLDGSLPSDAPPETVDRVAAIETSVSFTSGRRGAAAGSMKFWFNRLAGVEAYAAIGQSRTRMSAQVSGRGVVGRLIGGVDEARANTADEEDLSPSLSFPADSASSPSSPGTAQRLLIGGTAKRSPRSLLPATGRNIVVCQQSVKISSE